MVTKEESIRRGYGKVKRFELLICFVSSVEKFIHEIAFLFVYLFDKITM